MPKFTSIHIIYNPSSTGPSKKLAKDLAAVLQRAKSSTVVETIATKHAGHAEQLAYRLAKATARPLIISSSGDGGYHELINGIMKARSQGSRAVAGLLPGGNANDHYSHMHNDKALEFVKRGISDPIDVLQITLQSDKQILIRYSHSYAGIGLSPQAAQKLNENDLNRFNEKIIVLRSLWNLKPVVISTSQGKKVYDSLIFSNLPAMAKLLHLSNDASVHDGLFEITPFLHSSRAKLILSILRSATKTLPQSRHIKSYNFTAIKAPLLQLDGEIYNISKQTKVSIKVLPAALECII